MDDTVVVGTMSGNWFQKVWYTTHFSASDIAISRQGQQILRQHQEGMTWLFDDCGGHGDSYGHYHYHAPPLCLMKWLVRASSFSSTCLGGYMVAWILHHHTAVKRLRSPRCRKFVRYCRVMRMSSPTVGCWFQMCWSSIPKTVWCSLLDSRLSDVETTKQFFPWCLASNPIPNCIPGSGSITQPPLSPDMFPDFWVKPGCMVYWFSLVQWFAFFQGD